METVVVRGVEIGAGMPKICVPIVGITKEEIKQAAQTIKNEPIDLV
ncbi:MAG TPA: 3-dehydroquinate dehydratase, partial [Lachnospiraceae bacterium]|nr:3-dehydroquinate dehydratase [Lachnospiraceae bacterium]